MIDVLIFRLDRFSFWIGFIAGILFSWLILQARKALPRVAQALRAQIQATRESLTTGAESRMRLDVLNWAQHQHLAAALFSLDEIIVPPELLARPIIAADDENAPPTNITSAIPYLPDWPELASAYGAPTLTLSEALSGGSNLVIIGQPGSGKTVALNHLASQIARRDTTTGELSNLYPLLIPAAALINRLGSKEPVDSLIGVVASCYASPVTLPRLRNVIRTVLDAGRTLLLLDGLDELSPQAVEEIFIYLQSLLQRYPRLRLVVTASPGDFGRMHKLGLVPFAMAAWNEQKKLAFIDQWQTMWNRFVAPDSLSSAEFVDSLLLVKWLARRDRVSSPFDVTLRTWGAFAGDVLGPDTPSLIEAHIRRLTAGISNARSALEALALDMVNNYRPVIQQHEAETVIAHYGKIPVLADAPSESQAEEPVEATEKTKSSPGKTAPASQLISGLINNGLLTSFGNAQIAFAHPYLMGYLAGSAYGSSGDFAQLTSQPDWTGRFVTIGFLSNFRNISAIVDAMLDEGRQTPIHRQSFDVARWLDTSPKTSPWRANVMRYLLGIVQKDYETLGLAGRALTALTLAGDAGINNLLRQLLNSNHENIRQLAALGIGILGDSKSVPELISLLDDASPDVVRATCLGLIAIGNKAAVDAVITVLLNGSEENRRIASEALVNHPKEGVALLKEGLTMEDLLVRRAVIYGLVRGNDPDLRVLLEKVAVEDSQWVVRNAAAQALEQIRLPNPYIPRPYKPLTEQAWLINFAAKSGMGVGDNEQAINMVLQAFERGEILEKLHALEFLRLHNRLDAVPRLYNAFYGSQGQIREACYDVLWHTASSGIALPSPTQFGLG